LGFRGFFVKLRIFPFAFSLDRARVSAAMQCDYCESKATVFFTQIIDGKTTKSSLCDKCAAEQGVTDPEGFLIGHLQGALKGETKVPKPPIPVPDPPASTLVCKSCGFSYEDLKKTGRLGCSVCYQTFRKEITHNLGGMHKGVHHKGRVPEGMMKAFEQRQKLETLQSEMQEAISAEDYEKAAVLRDVIRKLKDDSLTSIS